MHAVSETYTDYSMDKGGYLIRVGVRAKKGSFQTPTLVIKGIITDGKEEERRTV